MPYNFDTIIERAGTSSVKYDLRKALFGRDDVIPMWVADMDFAVPHFVEEAVLNRARHPIYGYTVIPESYTEAVAGWQKSRYNWEIENNWLFFSPGVVAGLNMIVQAFTRPGDAVIVQPPVYFPFFSCVENNGRRLVLNQLKEQNGDYTIDFEDLEQKMKAGARMMILCSPHNPVSRSWSREELERLGEKCLEYGILMVSDEIHGDLVFGPHRHIPMASLSPEIADNTITCIAPSKTFNLAGLFTSSIIIPNEKLRETFKKHQETLHLSPNLFGLVAAEAAYREGGSWLDELMHYLKDNISIVSGYLSRNLPGITFSKAEATYMLWLDFRKTGIPPAEMKSRLVEKAGLGLVEGPVFGQGGNGFQRMNIACPRTVLIGALERLPLALNP